MNDRVCSEQSPGDTNLSEVALKLRRELPPKAPLLKTVLKTAIKAERVLFHLKRALQQLVVEDFEQATGRERLPEGRRSGKVADVKPLLRPKARHEEP